MDKKLLIYVFSSLMLASLIFTGCKSAFFTGPPRLHVYEGPAREENQVGSFTRVQFLNVDKIDGKTYAEIKKMSNFEGTLLYGRDTFSAWELLPGEHTVIIFGASGTDVTIRGPVVDNQEEYTIKTFPYGDVKIGFHEHYNVKGRWELTFTVEPGHKYSIQYDTKDEQGLMGTVSRVYPYVIDKITKEKIGTCKRLKKKQ